MIVAGLQPLSFLSFFYVITRSNGKITITAEDHPGTIPTVIDNAVFYKPGDSLTLRCTSDSAASVKWTRPSHDASKKLGPPPPGIEHPSGGGLDLKPINATDGGNYSCMDQTTPGIFQLNVLHADSLVARDKITNGTDHRVYLTCDQRFSKKFPLKWRSDDFPGDLNAIPKENHTFWVDKDKEHRLVVYNPDYYRYPSKTGRYTCELDIPGLSPPISKSLYYHAKPDVRFYVPPSTTLGETSKGDDYELTCIYNGQDADGAVKWTRVVNETYNETLFDFNGTRSACADALTTGTLCRSAEDQRIRLKRNDELEQHDDLKSQQERTSVLVIKNISESDRAEYRCYVRNQYGDSYVGQFIRVRDRMAALWPFLGVLAEITFLGIVIFICEKRRSKQVDEEADAQPMLDQDATRNQDATREVSLRNRK